VAADGSMTVNIAKQEGTWKPWWKAYRIEVVGWVPKQRRAAVNGRNSTFAEVNGRWGVTVAADGSAQEVDLR
jgi:alpha-glucosidase